MIGDRLSLDCKRTLVTGVARGMGRGTLHAADAGLLCPLGE